MGAMTEKAIAPGAGSVGHWAGCHATPQDQNAPAVGDLSVSDKMSRYSVSVDSDLRVENTMLIVPGVSLGNKR